jgi:protein O-mannosyl-transferase
MDCTRKALCTVLLCLFLSGATLAVFWPVLQSAFTNYDDNVYVTANPHVLGGLSWNNALWAFQAYHGNNWHPVTWLSHMLDVQLFGLRPGWHHAVNLLFHTANAVLLFLLLQRLTGAFWRSAFVAAFFALHPTHVESVAWVAERKDVLSTFFFLLTLFTYAEYAARKENRGLRMERDRDSLESQVSSPARPGPTAPSSILHPPSSTTSGLSLWYTLSLLLFALGLMSKPMLVTLPCVLLLLDYWPLQRFSLSTIHSQLSTLLLEKLPFFALAAASVILTLIAQSQQGALVDFGDSRLGLRLANALVSYVRYLGKTIWPEDLAIFYPYPPAWPLWQVVAAGGVLLLASGLALWSGRTGSAGIPAGVGPTAPTPAGCRRSQWRGYVPMGWFWFVGTLVPVIGLIQVGGQSMADRYTYLPLIGLFVLIVWGAADLTASSRHNVNTLERYNGQPAPGLVAPQATRLCTGWPWRRLGLGTAALVLLAACALLARRQALCWANSSSLFTHALAVTTNNWAAHENLGLSYLEAGRLKEAHAHLAAAVRLKPDLPISRSNLGLLLATEGHLDEAIDEYREALRLGSPFASIHGNLANALWAKGLKDEALAEFAAAVQLEPDSPAAQYQLGTALAATGQPTQAAEHLAAVLQLQPHHTEAHYQLGLLLLKQGQPGEALPHLEAAQHQHPKDPALHCQLGLALSALNQTQEAVAHYRQALALKPDQPEALNNLAWILAASAQPTLRNGPEAVRLAERAVQLTTNREPMLVGTLAAAYAEAGRFDEAIATAQKAIQLATAAGHPELARRNEELLGRYRAHQPFHEP